MIFRYLEKLARYFLDTHHIIVKRTEEGILKNGSFSPMDFSVYDIVDKTKYLIVEKGKYKIVHRSDHAGEQSVESPGMSVIDNLRSSYDKFWQSDAIVEEYLEEGRKRFYRDVFLLCRNYIRGKVFDIGCGSGFFLGIVSTLGGLGELYGADFSSASLKRCRDGIPDGRFILSDIFSLGCKTGYFDTVICMETLEHIENPRHALGEALRVCRNEGYIIVTIPNGIYDNYIGHLNFWSKSDFERFLDGITVADFHYIDGGKDMVFVLKRT